MSPVRPDVSRDLAQQGRGHGLRVLEAPVSGGEAGAVEGALSIMVGGEQADFDAARPLFDVLGKTPVLVGPYGAGQTVKGANQLIVAGHLQLLAEALVFLEAHGVETGPGLEVLGGGLAGSTVLQRKGVAMRERDFQPGFRIALHDKDLRIVTDAARTSGVTVPLGAQVAQLVGALNRQGHGDLDHSALLRLVEELSGRRVFDPAEVRETLTWACKEARATSRPVLVEIMIEREANTPHGPSIDAVKEFEPLPGA